MYGQSYGEVCLLCGCVFFFCAGAWARHTSKNKSVREHVQCDTSICKYQRITNICKYKCATSISKDNVMPESVNTNVHNVWDAVIPVVFEQ